MVYLSIRGMRYMGVKRTRGASRIGHAARFGGLRQAKAWVTVLTLAVLAIPVTVSGLTSLSQSYTAKDKLAPGSIVSLQNNSSDTISATTITNVNGILGIVINDGNSLLSLTNDGASQIQVASTGVAQVLVSDINGGIAQGDQITASPVAGVGMKATTSVKVVGIAQDGLKKEQGSNESYTDKSGQKHSVLIGQVPVLINVSYYYKQADKTLIPSAVQNLANALAGKPVNSLPILLSLGVFFVTLIIVVSIIYSMIRSSIISVGRNPMSQSAIYRDIIQLSALVVGLLVVAVVSIYMILTRF